MIGVNKIDMNRSEKAKWIGEVKPKNSGDHVIDPEKLSAPFGGNKSLSRFFCSGCGNMVEINNPTVKHLVAVMNLRTMPNVTGKYFQVGSCPNCGTSSTGGPFFTGVSLRDLPAVSGQ